MNAPKIEEPLELVVKKTPEKAVAYACSECGALFTGAVFGGGENGLLAAKMQAADHCIPRMCGCGSPVQKGWTICQACVKKKDEDKENARFQKAEKLAIADYDGPVYWGDGPDGSMGEGYYSDIDDLLDRCEEEGIDLPLFVWTSKKVPFRIDADHAIENALSDHHEGAYDKITPAALGQLQDLLDEWCGKQNIESWEPDFSRAVVLQPE
jgi:hypothetical protein